MIPLSDGTIFSQHGSQLNIQSQCPPTWLLAIAIQMYGVQGNLFNIKHMVFSTIHRLVHNLVLKISLMLINCGYYILGTAFLHHLSLSQSEPPLGTTSTSTNNLDIGISM